MLDSGDVIVWQLSKNYETIVYIKNFVPTKAKRVTNISHMFVSQIEYKIILEIMDCKGNEYDDIVLLSNYNYPLVCIKNNQTNLNCAKSINVHKYKDHCGFKFV